MLVLSRKLSEKIKIGDDITIIIAKIENGKVRVGIEAPREKAITRPDIAKRTPLAVDLATESGQVSGGGQRTFHPTGTRNAIIRREDEPETKRQGESRA